MDTRVVEVTLPNGQTALVRAADMDATGATSKSVLPRLDFNGVAGTLEGISDAIRSAVQSAAPDNVTVQLGIELAVKAGRLTGLLVEGEGKGALTVTLEWKGAAG